MFGKRKTDTEQKKLPLTPEQRKKRRKRRILGGVAAALLAVTVLPRLFAPESLPVVSVTEASTGSVRQLVEGSGTVRSERVKVYFSPVTASVDSFGLQVGDRVEAGETLLTYDATELGELYQQAELTGSAAGYSYQDSITRDNENVAEYNRSTAALEIINRQLEEEDANLDHLNSRIREYTGYQADSANKLAALREQLAQLQAAMEEGKTEAAGAATEGADSAGTASAGAQPSDTETANREAVAARLAELEKSIQEEQDNYNHICVKLDEYQGRLSDSQENRQKLESSKAKEEGIQSSSDAAILSSAARKELEANRDLNSLNAQMTKDDIAEGQKGIQAEFSGIVTSVSAVAGGPAAKGGELFAIAGNEDVAVEMNITRYDLEKIAEGQSAAITLAGWKYSGTVTALSHIAGENAKGTPVVTARIRIDDPDENIVLGLEASVTVYGQEASDVIVVPAECVNSGRDGEFCYVVGQDGVMEKRGVETGISSGDLTEIVSGLKAGEKVVSGGITAGVQEGTRVTAVEE